MLVFEALEKTQVQPYIVLEILALGAALDLADREYRSLQ